MRRATVAIVFSACGARSLRVEWVGAACERFLDVLGSRVDASFPCESLADR